MNETQEGEENNLRTKITNSALIGAFIAASGAGCNTNPRNINDIPYQTPSALVENVNISNLENSTTVPALKDNILTNSFDVEDIVLSSEVSEILTLTPSVEFDQEGQLFFKEDNQLKPVSIFETDRHLTYPYEKMKEVKFFVIHYDAGPANLSTGKPRTVFNTLNGLNGIGLPSVQFCIDSYPITNKAQDDKGMGIILSQKPSELPYKGRHIGIGKNLETGEPDINRIKTAELFVNLNIKSDLIDFVSTNNTNFDENSLGVEQVGEKFSRNFPEFFPPAQEIANILALSSAVALKYDLSVWEIVGHNEIQEKSDPGDEYMSTLRYLLGIQYLTEPNKFPEDFLKGDTVEEYLTKLKDYSMSRMGEERYQKWNQIYGLDNFLYQMKTNTKEDVPSIE